MGLVDVEQRHVRLGAEESRLGRQIGIHRAERRDDLQRLFILADGHELARGLHAQRMGLDALARGRGDSEMACTLAG